MADPGAVTPGGSSQGTLFLDVGASGPVEPLGRDEDHQPDGTVQV
jgi:hypothetical protein